MRSPGNTFDRGHPIQLVTTNHMADRINHNYLDRLTGKAQLYTGEIQGTFGERQLPTHEKLRLRPQARVMLLNNDSDGRWINGDLGWVETLPDASDLDQGHSGQARPGEQVTVVRKIQMGGDSVSLQPGAQPHRV